MHPAAPPRLPLISLRKRPTQNNFFLSSPHVKDLAALQSSCAAAPEPPPASTPSAAPEPPTNFSLDSPFPNPLFLPTLLGRPCPPPLRRSPPPGSSTSPPRMTTMSEGEEERFAALFGIVQECVTADDLQPLLRGKPYPVCYDGFEPSSRMHIAQGVVKVINVNKTVRVGWHVKIWIADWFAQLNTSWRAISIKYRTLAYLLGVAATMVSALLRCCSTAIAAMCGNCFGVMEMYHMQK